VVWEKDFLLHKQVESVDEESPRQRESQRRRESQRQRELAEDVEEEGK
jgi:hypothetical protein